jgi:hypothetical protein
MRDKQHLPFYLDKAPLTKLSLVPVIRLIFSHRRSFDFAVYLNLLTSLKKTAKSISTYICVNETFFYVTDYG